MAKPLRISLAPALVVLAALFIVLPQGGGDAEVAMTGESSAWRFEPSKVGANPGDRIGFVNRTQATHTATCVGCPWDTGDVQPGQTKFLSFGEVASYRFFCRYHGASQGMVGELIVGDAPPPDDPGASPSPSPSL